MGHAFALIDANSQILIGANLNIAKSWRNLTLKTTSSLQRDCKALFRRKGPVNMTHIRV
jgi:hypothetical protein